MAIDDLLENKEVLVVFNNDMLSIRLSIRKPLSNIRMPKEGGMSECHVIYPVC